MDWYVVEREYPRRCKNIFRKKIQKIMIFKYTYKLYNFAEKTDKPDFEQVITGFEQVIRTSYIIPLLT